MKRKNTIVFIIVFDVVTLFCFSAAPGTEMSSLLPGDDDC